MTDTSKETTKTETAFSIDTLVGMAKEAAKAAAELAGYKTRVAEEDGVASMLSMDINPKRVNFFITAGKITKAKVG